MAEMKLIISTDANGLTTEKYVPLSKAEIAQREADAIAYAEEQAAREAEAKAIADAKASAITKLSKLGLSDAEIAALVGA